MSAVLGYDGQSVYAADNRFLDGLTSMRRSRGMGGLSIQWPAISGVGMAGADLSLTVSGNSIGPEEVSQVLEDSRSSL